MTPKRENGPAALEQNLVQTKGKIMTGNRSTGITEPQKIDRGWRIIVSLPPTSDGRRRYQTLVQPNLADLYRAVGDFLRDNPELPHLGVNR